MKGLLNDVRTAFRSLRMRPGFSAITILTLALGIGVNTAIFGLIHHVMLTPLPYPDPDRLVKLNMRAVGGEFASGEGGGMDLPWSYPFFTELQQNHPAFEGVAAYAGFQFNLGGDNPERLSVELVSADYFRLLGLSPIQGRVFLPEEDQTPGAHPVALISHRLWQQRFGASPVTGKVIRLDDTPLTVVGVLPAGFQGLTGSAQVWVPIMMAPELMMPRRLEMRFAHWHEVVARLKPGITPARMQAQLGALMRQSAEKEALPEFYGDLQIRAVPLNEAGADPQLNRALLVLFAAVGLVLVIACVNAVSLLLVRAVKRRRELAVRVALGASRPRLTRLFLTESLMLGLFGGLVGLLVAYFAIRLAAVYGPVSLPPSPLEAAPPDALHFESISLGAPVLAANLAFALLAGLLAGVLPALRAARVDVNSGLKSQTPKLAVSLRKLKSSTLAALVVVEISLSLVLLVGAGLLIRSFSKLSATDLGFASAGVLTLSVSHPFKQAYKPERVTFYEQLLERVGHLPGVDAVTVANRLPMSVGREATTLTIEGRPQPAGSAPVVGVHMVGPEHFKTFSIPLVGGRPFTAQDRQGAPKVAILNQTAARRFFPGQNPIGKRVQLGLGWEENEFAEVVGVVGDVVYKEVGSPMDADVYVPFFQNVIGHVYLVVKSAGQRPESLVPSVRSAVQTLDPTIPIFNVKTMDQQIADVTSKARFMTFLLTTFALVAGALAAIGLYGVMAYSISGRTVEIGVRMALGAPPVTILRMVVSDTLILAGTGLLLGLGLAIAFGRALSSFLYEMSSNDPVTFAAVSALVLVVSVLAGLLPARSAIKFDPKVALRYE